MKDYLIICLEALLINPMKRFCVFIFYLEVLLHSYRNYFICVLANKVEGKTLIRLTRSDLTDLIPGDFLARKELWDLVEYLVRAENSSVCLMTYHYKER